MTLLHPAWLIAAAVALVLFAFMRRGAAGDDWQRVLSSDVLVFLTGRGREKPGHDLTLLALAATLAALASPAVRGPAQSFVPTEGVILLMDVSRSMTLDDIRPSRLSGARAAAAALAAASGAKPVAMIVFAGDAFVAQPFSRDRTQLNSFIAKFDHGLITQEGSDIERALALTQSVLRQSGMAASRVVLVSDAGGVTAGAIESAAALHKSGARIDGLLMVGTAGNTTDRPDVSGFQRLIEAGGGVTVRSDVFGVAEIDHLNLGSGTRTDRYSLLSTSTTDWHNLSHWLLLAAAPLFLLLFRRRTT